MAFSVTTSKTDHRADNATLPVLTPVDHAAKARWYIPDLVYKAVSGALSLSPRNRTEAILARVRNMTTATYTEYFGATRNLTDTSEGNFDKSGTGYAGAIHTGVASGDTSIEGIPSTISGSFGLYLQSGTVTLEPDNGDLRAEHALVLRAGGDGQIWEHGVLKQTFKWIAGDKGLVEKIGTVVKYWIIHSDFTMVLIRVSRSLLDYPIYPTVMIYNDATSMNGVLHWTGAEVSVNVNNWAVLPGSYQDLQNPMAIESLADTVMTKDRKEDHTFFADERELRTLSIGLEWRFKEDYEALVDFFRWHNVTKPFIFVDKSRPKMNPHGPLSQLAANEMWSRFVRDNGLKDNYQGAELYGMSVDIRQEIDPPVLPVGA